MGKLVDRTIVAIHAYESRGCATTPCHHVKATKGDDGPMQGTGVLLDPVDQTGSVLGGVWCK
jgi:hypothetical protein